MAFDKKRHLRQNIDAIKAVFKIEKEGRTATAEEKNLLKQFSGFGGLKFILNPVGLPDDINQWKASDINYFPSTQELHTVIRENSATESIYHQYVSGLKASILDAFFTPQDISDCICSIIKDSGIQVDRMLEPSAGVGAFITPFAEQEDMQISAFEQDLITGKILKYLHGDKVDVHIEGFEKIKDHEKDYDLVIGNIPFGTTSVFDLSYSRGHDPARKFAAQSIHNYFFLKATDKLRDGGLLAFITTQGILNSPSNQIIREALMREHRLVSAIRLPNNLFDDSGTSVGTDLIILQKDIRRCSLSHRAKDFIGTVSTPDGENRNLLFYNQNNILFTSSEAGTDPYGKPRTIYLYDGDMEEISTELRQKLNVDFGSYFDHQLYGKPENIQIGKGSLVEIKPSTISDDITIEREKLAIVQLSLFSETELSGSSPKKPARKGRPPKKKVNLPKQLSLFDSEISDSGQNQQVKTPGAEIKQQRSKPRISRSKESTGSLFHDYHESIPSNDASSVFDQEIKEFYRDNTLVKTDRNVGRIKWSKEEGKYFFYPIKMSEQDFERIATYIRLRDCYYALYAFEASAQEEDQQNRQLLNSLYDNFVHRFGKLNTAENIRFIKLDSEGNAVSALERVVGGVIHKSDIFDHPVSFTTKEVSVNSPLEALSASLNQYGRVDLAYMCRISGLDEAEVREKLHGHIYYNPLLGGLEVSQKFLSGNVVEKAMLLQEYVLTHPEDVDAKISLAALEQVRPEKIQFEQLDFNLGERWIGTDIYNKFASHLFDTEVSIYYSESSDDFSVSAKANTIKITDKYAIKSESRTFDGLNLLRHGLVNTTPDITKTEYLADGKPIKVKDMEAIQMANGKIDEIRHEFTDWLYQQDELFKNSLTERYNNLFNCYVRPHYDGSHQTFPGLDRRALGIEDLYGSQKDAVWMLKSNAGGICDHEVGAGKTLIMCTGAQEMKRLGLVHKPMIIALKANVHEIAETYRKGYPFAKILYPGKKDFTPQKRLKIFGDIKNNDWDCIILTHDQFGMVPQSAELQKEILQAELDSVEQNLDVLRRQGKDVSGAMLKEWRSGEKT